MSESCSILKKTKIVDAELPELIDISWMKIKVVWHLKRGVAYNVA
jgi:hypothetical protein